MLRLGIDIGSTTLKVVVLDPQDQMIYSKYQRHYSDIKPTLEVLLEEVHQTFKNECMQIVMTGSGGLSYAKSLGISFEQEVIACSEAVEKLIPKTDVAIELGGEDAKITYFESSLDQRMNGTCAGGTGAFIDQMAALLETDAMGLNELAKNYQVIYPIAARCGVFAKTDVQPLINEGAAKEDIAASIFQAVVNQTISGLAWGKPIRGHVALLGGPLFFLSSLRQRFIETLDLNDETAIIPENGQYFVAMGACFLASSKQEMDLGLIIKQIHEIESVETQDLETVKTLFETKEDYQLFKARHQLHEVERVDLNTYQGKAFLGIDAGSTTTKMVLTTPTGAILTEFYGANKADPLSLCIEVLKSIHKQLPEGVEIVNSAVTGYGEALIKNALKIDIGEVETIAHYKASNHFLPGVEFILDIGGQDMKAIKIKDGVIQNILLNEACSSGCGSFLESFAKSLGLELDAFIEEAIQAKDPVDLGTRCTVFMNSKVKQAQKEGASIGGISAGLSYSVIKNALYKVIKIRSLDDIGSKIVVQGGTFYNDAVLRAFELVSGLEVVRPDIAGLMGAYGAALIACERYEEGHQSTILNEKQLAFTSEKFFTHCKLCSNQCLLTITKLSDGREHISGNRCERGLGMTITEEKMPNLYQYKYRRLFGYRSLQKNEAIRGDVGIPRVLNMYENYPFWHTFFTKLGFRVVLSSRSSKAIYEKGMHTIPSESVCYPAKLAHGHLVDLLEKNVSFIFYPSVVFEQREYKDAGNHFNCPIVTSYPEVLKNNTNIDTNTTTFMNPFLNLNDANAVYKVLKKELSSFNISDSELKHAIKKAYKEQEQFKKDIENEALKIIDFLEDTNNRAIVLAGRPYHLDNEVHHGIDQLIVEQGMAVLTEDAIAHIDQLKNPLRVVDQWTYHSRLYRAAQFVSNHPQLDMVQLISFGCGLDAVTAEQVSEILESKGKVHTMIKIDEVSNLGAIKIRIRSLKAALDERQKLGIQVKELESHQWHIPFTKEMKKEHTILAPQMSPIHFQFFEDALSSEGYRVVVLEDLTNHAIEEGLKYVNNDACYPSIIVVGQILEAIKSNQYDTDHLSVMITQTGGGCRATNYIGFLRRALKDAGYGHIPVISVNAIGLEKNPGFSLSFSMIKKLLMAVVYGDLFMNVLYRTRPYEVVENSANALYQKWVIKAKENIQSGNMQLYKSQIKEIVRDFDQLPLKDIKKPRVGLVGEILVKFHPGANNDIVTLLENEGAEAVMPDLLGFFLYSAYNNNFKHEQLGGSFKSKIGSNIAIWYIETYRKTMIQALNESKRFHAPWTIDKIAKKAQPLLSLGNQTGEGWFLTGEMIELVETDVPNIICMQPFACLPNHVTGKGMIKVMKDHYPDVNLAMIDYDPGASESNQVNRIKMMLSTAFKKL